MTSTEVVFKPVRELSEMVRTRQTSPVELTDIFLERLEILGPKYNAVVTLTRELAIAQAQRAENEIAAGQFRGPLHGVPYGLKDLFATDGIPTTWGAAPFKDQVFGYNSTIVRKLEEAGAVLCAKLAMVELAGGIRYTQPNASFTGPGINPWGGETWSGGSSSGSGSAVAGGLVPFAIGTETWGSILSPASNCGVAGLRPTLGRVSRHGGMSLTWTMDKPGPLCLTADDCGVVLEAISGHDPNDESTTRRPYVYEPQKSDGVRFRLAVPTDATAGADQAVRDHFKQVLTELGRVAIIDEVELPDLPYGAVATTIFMAESASIFQEFIESGRASDLTAPENRYGIYARTAMLATDYLKAVRLRRYIAIMIDDLLSQYDALLAPRQPSTAPPLGKDWIRGFKQRSGDKLGAIGNSVGLPAISVPMGFSDEGLPTGLQILGRAYNENVVLAIANAYQSTTSWHLRHPVDPPPKK